MKVLVCGGRNYEGWDALCGALDSLGVTHLIHGGASGADALAQVWAKKNNVPVTMFVANWREHGKAAGPIRNRQMLVEGKPDLVVAFPGGRGTADMIRQAEAAGVRVSRVTTDE